MCLNIDIVLDIFAKDYNLNTFDAWYWVDDDRYGINLYYLKGRQTIKIVSNCSKNTQWTIIRLQICEKLCSLNVKLRTEKEWDLPNLRQVTDLEWHSMECLPTIV